MQSLKDFFGPVRRLCLPQGDELGRGSSGELGAPLALWGVFKKTNPKGLVGNEPRLSRNEPLAGPAGFCIVILQSRQ